MSSLLLGTVQTQLKVYLQDLLPFFVTFKRKYCDTFFSFCKRPLTVLMTTQNMLKIFLRCVPFVLANWGSSLSEWGQYSKHKVHKCPPMTRLILKAVFQRSENIIREQSVAPILVMQQTKLSQEEGDEMLIRVFLFCEIYLKACSNIKVEGKTNKNKQTKSW